MTEAASPPPGTRRNGFARALSLPNFRNVYLAGVASRAGSAIAFVAITWIVFSTTGSALAITYVAVAEMAGAILFTLPSGVWVDRHDRTRLMVLADVLRAGAMGGMAVSFVVFGFRLVTVIVAMFVVAGVGMLFQPAEQVLIPSLVPAESLANANGLNRATRSIVSLFGSSIGGILVVAAGATLSIALNSVTYVISALLILAVYRALRASDRKTTRTPRKERHMGQEIVEGFRWLIHKAPGLWQLSISALFLNFFATIFGTFMVVYVVEGLHASSITYGLFVATGTAGGALGSLLVGRAGAVRWVGKVWILGAGVAPGVLLVALALVHTYWAFPLIFLFDLILGFAGNTWLTAAQLLVPAEFQGRYFALDGLLSWGVIPIAQVAGGLLIEAVGIGTTLEYAGLGLLACGLLSMAGRELWRLGVAPHPAA